MSASERALTEVWYGRSSVGVWLQPLASLYGAVTAARRGLYAARILPSYNVGRPVVVVGDPTKADLDACWELGAASAAALTLA